MDETIMRKQYVTPSFTVTAFRFKDVILTSPEHYASSVIDGGDWGDDWGDDGNSLENEIG